MYQALYRKWRPQVFADVVGQPQVTDTLRRQVAGGRLSHAYLFTGTRGTGKTTCAKLLAKAANCENPHDGEPCNACHSCVGIGDGSIADVFEIDAASNSGVDNIRTIREQTAYAPVETRYRVYIIDECHMLSSGAFNALLKTLEEPPEHVLFILATTALHKVPVTILSRCQRFSFRRLTVRDLTVRLLEIAAVEGISLADDGAACIARLSDGGARDAISMLDQCASSSNGARLDENGVLAALGLASHHEVLGIAQAVAERNITAALSSLDAVYMGGKDESALLSELGVLLRDALIVAATGDTTLISGGYAVAALTALNLDTHRLCVMLTSLADTQSRLQRSLNKRLDVEICLIELCSDLTRAAYQSAPAQSSAASAQPVFTPTKPTPAQTAPPSFAPPQPAPLPESAPDSDDDPPPWSITDMLKDAGARSVVVPPPADEKPVTVLKKKPQPTGWWKATLDALNGVMPMSQFMQLNTQPPAELDGDRVLIIVNSPFAKNLLGDKKILDMIAAAASEALCRTVTCKVKTHDEVATSEPTGSIDELLELSKKFDNFDVE